MQENQSNKKKSSAGSQDTMLQRIKDIRDALQIIKATIALLEKFIQWLTSPGVSIIKLLQLYNNKIQPPHETKIQISILLQSVFLNIRVLAHLTPGLLIHETPMKHSNVFCDPNDQKSEILR